MSELPGQKWFSNPPPLPVGATATVTSECSFSNFSPTAVAIGNTVELPFMSISPESDPLDPSEPSELLPPSPPSSFSEHPAITIEAVATPDEARNFRRETPVG
jgi:hypothetical protein